MSTRAVPASGLGRTPDLARRRGDQMVRAGFDRATASAFAHPSGMRPLVLPQPSESSDSTSDDWLERLRADGSARQRAEADLHALLLRAARFEIGRRQAALSHVRGDELDDLAQQAADDALLAVLGKLDQFRGASRFTTWAYKFALLEAGVRLRRRAWQEREVALDADSWPAVADVTASPHDRAHANELIAAIRESIESCLTPHQRNVLEALALNGVPIDVLSEHLNTTRGALYKTLHDARRKLRNNLETKGFSADSI